MLLTKAQGNVQVGDPALSDGMLAAATLTPKPQPAVVRLPRRDQGIQPGSWRPSRGPPVRTEALRARSPSPRRCNFGWPAGASPLLPPRRCRRSRRWACCAPSRRTQRARPCSCRASAAATCGSCTGGGWGSGQGGRPRWLVWGGACRATPAPCRVSQAPGWNQNRSRRGSLHVREEVLFHTRTPYGHDDDGT